MKPFLDAAHDDIAASARAIATELSARSAPDDDAAARQEARTVLEAMGRAGCLRPIAERDLRGCCIVREALAGVSPLADAVFAIQALGANPLLIAGSEVQRSRWLPGLTDGTVMAGFAMTERGAGSDVAAMKTTARRDNHEWVIDGQKTLISNAGIADVYIVFASTDPSAAGRGISCFIVPAEAPGLRFAGAQVMSAPHPLGELDFEGCRVPADSLVGDEGRGFALGMATLDRVRPTVAAAACGMAARALDEALRHAVGRTQFGQPLAQFQLVQEKLGRMAIDLTAARLLVYNAAWAGDRGAERITLEAAMAKAFATEAAQRIVDDAVQIIGGRGVLADHPVDRLYRAVRALRIYEGTTEIQHLIVASQLVRQAEATRPNGATAS